MPYGDLIDKHANRTGVPADWLHKIMRVESGGEASQVTGSYKGLFQLSNQEFSRHGGSGSIFDPEQNIMAASNKIAQEARDFKARYGRDATLKDIYMVHQQGAAGYAAHMANPDQPAWKSMLSTGEGRRKGEAWAKKAIWGNLSDTDKAKYRSVENVTSRDFVEGWGTRVSTISPTEHRRTGRTPWKRSGAQPGEASEVEERSTEPTRKEGEDWQPYIAPQREYPVADMVPRMKPI